MKQNQINAVIQHMASENCLQCREHEEHMKKVYEAIKNEEAIK